jgi:hypothetical protein
MAATIRIKRRASSGGAGAPSSLANAELAYNEATDIGYYGSGTGGAGGSATSVVAAFGTGAFLGLSSGLTQTAAGTYTFSGGITFSSTVALGSSATATTPSSSDDSTAVATTAYVKAQNYLTANQTVTLSGDATGSGTTSITVTIANDAVTNQKLANMAANTIKGRKTASTGDPEDLSASDVKTILAIVKADISDFDTSVQANRLDQMAAPTTSVSLNSQKITNLATPTDANDAANKAYVDAARSGLDVKQSVRAATTANIDLSTDLENGDAIDGVTLATGDRVLVKNQSTGSQNGIYVVAASGAASRATDFDSSEEVTPGAFMFVEEGTANADTGWVLTTDGAITVGTTSLVFAQFSGAGDVTAGDGLTKTGSTLDVVGTADRITVAADSVDIATTYVGQTSITTLGTVTTGTWSATAIAVDKGGTGLTSAPQGSVLIANTANTISALDGGGSVDGILTYTASSDTIAWATSIDGGTF